MQLILIILVVAIVAGFAAHGSVRPFERLHLHWWGAALAGLALQAVPLPAGSSPASITASLGASYALLIAFTWVNRRLPAAPLILLGLALNALVVVPNAGMPVSGEAVRIAGGESATVPVEGAGGADKHHLMSDEDVLRPLGDVIPGPPPLGDVLSVGDLFLYMGIASFVVLVMLGRFGENRRPPARWMKMYRGKHLDPHRRLPHRSPAQGSLPSAPVATARSGTAP
jgi:Family of unknown function (DUF5317)